MKECKWSATTTQRIWLGVECVTLSLSLSVCTQWRWVTFGKLKSQLASLVRLWTSDFLLSLHFKPFLLTWSQYWFVLYRVVLGSVHNSMRTIQTRRKLQKHMLLWCVWCAKSIFENIVRVRSCRSLVKSSKDRSYGRIESTQFQEILSLKILWVANSNYLHWTV